MATLKHVVLVDDNDEDIEFHELVLKDMKVAEKITSLSDPQKALIFFKDLLSGDGRTEPFPELIFLDTLMPKIDGFELLTMLKPLLDANKEHTGATKIFMLGGAYNYESEKFLSNPDYNYFLKGYQVKPLTKAGVADITRKHFGVSE